MTESRLREIEERAEGASKGPWIVKAPMVPVGLNKEDDRLICGEDGRHICETFQYQDHDNPNGPSIENALFIANARKDIPDLITEVRRLRKEESDEG